MQKKTRPELSITAEDREDPGLVEFVRLFEEVAWVEELYTGVYASRNDRLLDFLDAYRPGLPLSRMSNLLRQKLNMSTNSLKDMKRSARAIREGGPGAKRKPLSAKERRAYLAAIRAARHAYDKVMSEDDSAS
ncbi:hypothetical protein AB0O47_39250 [Streptomyces noursei]|uniref:hypothetical protein n=1 Tax=Streptomyces noursei TaxID=1971 RepID=UPI00344CDDAD